MDNDSDLLVPLSLRNWPTRQDGDGGDGWSNDQVVQNCRADEARRAGEDDMHRECV